MARRISRRQLLVAGGASLAAGVAGSVGLAALRGDGDGTPSAPSPTATSRPSTTPAPSPTPSPTRPPSGGVARMVAPARLNFDTFDAQRTGEPSVVEVLGRTHSRLVDWGRFDRPSLIPGLAAKWEQPDPQTLILTLDPNARWHDAPPLNGRALTAEDVVQHLNRARKSGGGAPPLAQRTSDYRNWASVSSPASNTVTIRSAPADPFVLQTLAGRYALVQAPQAVAAFEATWDRLDAASVVGTGPFRLTGRRPNGALTFAAERGGHLEPSLDGIELYQPGEPGDLLAQRRDEHLARDRRDAAELRANKTLIESLRYEASPVVSTFFTGAPPWNDAKLRRAISAALNRGWLAEQLFGGRADPCGPVSPASDEFALTPAQLASYPGYGTDGEADARNARALWDAAGGPALGSVTIDFPSIFDPLYSASSVVAGRLNAVLGQQFRPAVETYTVISTKSAEKRYGNGNAAFWFGWGPPLLEPEPSRSLIETYFSGGPNAEALGLQPSAVDLQLTRFSTPAQPAELHAAQRAILDAGGLGVITWLLQKGELFRWPYWAGPPATPFWSHHLDAHAYLDPSAPSFATRAP